MRASADNPAVDMDAPRRTLEFLRRSGADHVIEYGLPCRTAVEALTTAALAESARMTTSARDREHVTRCMRRDRRFFALAAIAPGSVRRPAVRLAVETRADLDFIRRVFGFSGATPGTPAPLADLIAAAERAMAAAVPESENAADLHQGPRSTDCTDVHRFVRDGTWHRSSCPGIRRFQEGWHRLHGSSGIVVPPTTPI